MKANDLSILEFIGNNNHKVFIIPPFQRNYEWTVEQCDELFDDIISAHDKGKPHYLGNIVYYTGKNNGAAFTEIILIDGQQRITTIVLLLCAIRDLSDDEELKESIDDQYLKNNVKNATLRVRLKQTSYDFESFCAVAEHTPNLHKESNIVKNYHHFIDRLKTSDIALEKIYDTIGQLQVVDVNLQIENDLEAVQTVFEKINSTGKPLSPADLIRNFLLISNSTEEQECLYQDYWVKIEKEIGNEFISRFAKDYLVLKTKDDVENDKVYAKFKAKISGDDVSHETVLAEMLHYAPFYAWLVAPERCADDEIKKSIKEFNVLQTDDVYPLYMYLLFERYDSHRAELRKMFRLLSDFLLRYRIVTPSGGGGALRAVIHQILEKMTDKENPLALNFDSLYYELSNSGNNSGRYPDDTEFKAALMQSKKINYRYGRVVFLRIEENGRHCISVPIEKVTVEHLMPQTLSPWWNEHLGGKEKAAELYEKYVNAVGNLTILSQGDNSAGSNRPWHEKAAQLKKSQFKVTEEVALYDEWSETQLEERNRKIAEAACKAVYPPLARTRPLKHSSAATGWYPVADIDTNMYSTRIQKLGYGEQEISVMAWNQLFNEVCRICHEIDPEKFNSAVKENKIHKSTNSKSDNSRKSPVISADKEELVNGKRIGGTDYFSESVLSSLSSRGYTKQLLDLYGITEQFRIYIVDKDDEL
ncbi:MAG: DUF262 domain-containing HNH endonuclease family protein [Treponemataceae bacterium]|nr:DUF262 domain-containing HNH endonuclease family protein [Treponemataceae bacterium]